MSVNVSRILYFAILLILSLNVVAYPYIAFNQGPEYDDTNVHAERRSQQLEGNNEPAGFMSKWRGLPLYIGKRDMQMVRIARRWPYDWREKYKFL